MSSIFKRIRSYNKLFGINRLGLRALFNQRVSIHETAVIGPDIMCYPNGRIQIGMAVKLFGRSILVGDDIPESFLEIGEGTKINYLFYVNYSGGCRIGKNCAVATGVSIITSSLDYEDAQLFSSAPNVNSSVIIEDNVWIGTGVTILPGVRIASGIIVGANSLVNQNLMSAGIYAGIPAIKIKDL